jgi:DNA-binding NtrC family response regulator
MREEPERRDLDAERSSPADPSHTILVVDDEPAPRDELVHSLEARGFQVVAAENCADALARLRVSGIDLVIATQSLGEGCGVDLLADVRQYWPNVGRILVSEWTDPELAQKAINRAAVSHLLAKPWTDDTLDEALRCLVPDAPDRSHLPAREEPAPISNAQFPRIVGRCAALQGLLELVRRVAQTDSTALITGETGTGKELIGRAIHEASRRGGRVFCAVNSAAFPETLLESELFGHRRGAFTGAASNTKGLFEHADKGTVFLDEVAEMPLSMQAKLLRFLQTGEIRPVGGESTRYVDVRLVTATNKDLEAQVAAGRFREDLYYRLAVIPIHVPPLRERLEDIPLLARHFLERMGEKTGKFGCEIEEDAFEVLMAYQWPGNVRELENVIERGVALCRGKRIGIADLPLRIRERRSPEAEGDIESLPGMERKHILETLDRVGWSRKRAAEVLQISTTTLWRRLRQFGIETDGRSERRASLSG